MEFAIDHLVAAFLLGMTITWTCLDLRKHLTK